MKLADDRILLSGLRFEGRHGVDPGESVRPQAFEVDVEVPVDARGAAERDSLDGALDYRRLRDIAAAVVEGPSRALVETLADAIVSRIITETGAAWARVRVTKLSPPGLGGRAAVEVARSREALARTTTLIELHVPDFRPVREFYGRLGFRVVRDEPASERGGYLVLARGENVLRFWPGTERASEHSYFRAFPAGSARGYGVEIVLPVDDLDDLYETALASGVVVDELRLRPWGARDFRLADPFGFYLRFTEPTRP